MPLPVIVVPIPVANVLAGFIGGYCAEKFIRHVEPKLTEKLDELKAEMAWRKAQRRNNDFAAEVRNGPRGHTDA